MMATMASNDIELASAPAPPTVGSPLQDVIYIDDAEDEDTKKRRDLEKSFWTRLWQGIAGASFGLNVAAIVIEGSAVAIIMGAIACATAPVVFKRQMDLQDTDCKWHLLCVLRQSRYLYCASWTPS